MTTKELLKTRNLTQSGISYELRKRFGIERTQAVIGRWLSGQMSPNIEIIKYLSIILEITCDDLINIILENKGATANICKI